MQCEWCQRQFRPWLTRFWYSVHVSRKGYMTGEIGRQWIEFNFDPPTSVVANGCPRLLIVDGHASHFTQDFLGYAKEHNIHALCLPPTQLMLCKVRCLLILQWYSLMSPNSIGYCWVLTIQVILSRGNGGTHSVQCQEDQQGWLSQGN